MPKIRAGMGDVEAPVVETWSDDDYARATGLMTILSPDGTADPASVPAIPQLLLRDYYETMLTARAAGGRMRARAEARGEDPVPSDQGCEAAIVGAVVALQQGDVVVPGRRELAGTVLLRGASVTALAAGVPLPRANGVLPASPHAATQLPHATGIAWAMKMQATARAGTPGRVALAFLDREATSAEDFHAGLNFAGVFRVPVVFVCINGGSGATVPAVETVSQTIAVKALAYGIAGVRVDGNDLFAVLAATRDAAARARRGDGATLIEAVLAANDDPLDRVGRWLVGQQILDAIGEAALRRKVDAEVEVGFFEQ